MTIHAPDDDSDERWKALHEHPEFAKVRAFDSPDVIAKAHANDPPPESNEEKARRMAEAWHRHAQATQPHFAEKTPPVEGDLTLEQQMGQAMLNEEFQHWISKPTEIEVDDYPI